MIKAGIVGGTGYTGVELLRLLAQHPQVQLQAITSRKEGGIRVADMFPSLRGKLDLTFSAPEEARLDQCDVVFFATPHGVAMAQAPQLVAAGVKIIDLAADFRLRDVHVFEKWYGMTHTCPDLLAQAAYGLVELNREAIGQAKVVGNPGCYPTTIQLGYYPLLKAGVIDAGHLIADCVSGVSGAGRKAETGLLFSEAADNFKAYGVSAHRHTPEAVQQLQCMTSAPIGLTFTPHLVPMVRGMHATLYARLTQQMSDQALQTLFETAYQNEVFVDVMPFGSHPETRSVRGANILRIALHRPQGEGTPKDMLVVLVAQDNLMKGASGQAVQCMNVMFGLEETCGLLHVPLLP